VLIVQGAYYYYFDETASQSLELGSKLYVHRLPPAFSTLQYAAFSGISTGTMATASIVLSRLRQARPPPAAGVLYDAYGIATAAPDGVA
jgi:hypothetical protein